MSKEKNKIEIKLDAASYDFVASTAKLLRLSPEDFLSKVVQSWITTLTQSMLITPESLKQTIKQYTV